MSKILVDFSQIAIEAAQGHFSLTKDQPTIDIVRHIILNAILSNKKKLGKYSEEVILCMDSRHYWRRDLFTYYKQNRKAAKEKSKFDWDTFFKAFNQIKDEFKENLPYKCVEVEKAEADDIIATLGLRYGSQEDVVILSSDKDFLQLQNIASKLKQYSPKHKGFIDPVSREYNLFEHIIRGDAGDGIPNIVSDDDVFMDPSKRAKSIFTKDIDSWRVYGIDQPDKFCTSVHMLDKYNRNRALIDLTMIPATVSSTIVEAYDIAPSNKNVFNYLVKHKMKKIMERGDI